MSVNREPTTVSFLLPRPSSSPTEPRWVKVSPEKTRLLSWSKVMLPGVRVRSLIGTCVKPLPVMRQPACPSAYPSDVLGTSQVACSKVIPLKVRFDNGAVPLPLPLTKVCTVGASTSALARFSPGRGT